MLGTQRVTGGWPRLILVVLLACLPRLTHAADVEYAVKAAFLLNFARFVEWQPSAFVDGPQSALEICILGDDRFGKVIDEVVQGESVNGRKLAVRRISAPPAPQACHVVFLDPGTKDMKKTLAEIPPGVLTVSEGDNFIREGGMISLVIDQRRVRFDINQSAAEQGGVKLSSKMLSLARVVAR